MKLPTRRDILKVSSAGIAMSSLGAGPLFAQPAAWPSKPITLLVGYPPGGLTDLGARLIQRGMQSALGQAFVVDNKPGAGGNIAAGEVSRMTEPSKLLIANTSITINPHTFPGNSVDPVSLTPIGMILESQLILCVNPSAPAKTYPEFVAWVKAESGKGQFSYASAGNGGNTHLAMEYFRERAGLPKMTQVPYKGSAPAITDVVSNQLPCLMDAASLLLPFIDSGKLRPILVTGRTRHPSLPNVPTATEAGISDYVVTAFVGLWGPPNTPADVVRKANAALNSALAEPAIRSQIEKNGDAVGGGTPERLGELTKRDFKLWGDVAKRNNIKVE